MGIKERQAVMRPLDIVILLKKISPAGYSMNGKQLAESLGISAAEVSIALERNRIAGLVDSEKTNPIKSRITSNGEDYVWRNPNGTARGQAITPLYDNVHIAVKNDGDFYAMLAIVDSLRLGKTRERQAAIEELKKYISQYVSFKQQ